jgi:hypothetical protein
VAPPIILTPREAQVLEITQSVLRSPHLHSYVTYQEVFGENGSAEQIAHLLSQSNLTQVLRTVAYIVHSMEQPGGPNPQLQVNLVTRLLDTTARCRLSQSDWGVKPHRITVFHRQQQLHLLKLALLTCSVEGQPEWSESARYAYGMACLMVNDTLSPPSPDSGSQDHELGDVAVIMPLDEFGHSVNPMAAVGRAQRLWLSSQMNDALQTKSRLPPFDEIFKFRYGVTLSDFITVVLGVLSKCLQFRSSARDWLTKLTVNQSTFLGSSAFPQQSFERVLKIVSGTPKELALKLRTWPNQDNAWNFSVLQRHPLVHYQDGFYLCHDTTYLVRMLSEGIYWLLIDGLGDSERDSFHTFFGEVFASYVDEIFRAIYPTPRKAIRHYHPGLRFTDTSDQVCDGLLDLGDVLVLMEFKASMLTREARSSGNPELLKMDLDRRFANEHKGRRKGVFQLAASIKRFAEGWTVPVDEFDFSRYKAIIPALVTYDSALEAPGVRRYLDGKFNESLSDISRAALPIGKLMILTIRDVECLEAISHRYALRDVFMSYQQSAEYPLPFYHFLYNNHRRQMKHSDTIVAKACQEAMSTALARLFGRSLSSRSDLHRGQ